MSSAADESPEATHGWPSGHRHGIFAVALALATVALMLAGVFRAAEWYAERVLLPRYCANPHGAVAMVARVLTESQPAGAGSSRPYAVAAKLLFLVPQRDGEPTEAYIARLREHIDAACR